MGSAPLEPGPGFPNALAEALAALHAVVDNYPSSRQLRVFQQIRSAVSVWEAEHLASSTMSEKGALQAIQASGVSKVDSHRTRERAEVLAEKPEIAERMASGEVTTGQVDEIAAVARKSDGAALQDDRLLEKMLRQRPDHARKIGADWNKQRLTEAQVAEQYDRARKHRTVTMRDSDLPGESILTVVGDTPTVKQLFNQLTVDADTAYRAEGGRNIPESEHKTTLGQRLFDALRHRIMNPTPSKSAGSGRSTAGSNRSTVVFTKTLDDPDAPALMNGEPIPESMFDHAICNAELIGQLYNGSGDLIWQGRTSRNPSKALRTALIARDKGCVLCGKDPTFCETHHLIPWNAPKRGSTNPDNMALLCQTCHRHIHDQQLTLERTTNHRETSISEATCCGEAAGISKPAVQGAAANTSGATCCSEAANNSEAACCGKAARPSASWQVRPAKPHELPTDRGKGYPRSKSDERSYEQQLL